jgi:hypothetical protein
MEKDLDIKLYNEYLDGNKVEIKEWNFYKQNKLLEESYANLIVNSFLQKIWRGKRRI